MTFDRVLPELIRLCAEDPATRDEIQRYCVARDVRGRARLVVEPKGKAPFTELERRLSGALGAYFVPPILSTKGSGNEQRLASQLFDRAKGTWPKGWPRSYRNVLGGGDTPIDLGARWVGIERTVGKEAWLAAQLDGGAGQNITVFPAGSVDDSYIQKLARLDFSSTEPGKKNPVGYALEAMLHKLRADYDVILLDARAGLHDLAGMSLHGLAHVDVLVFRSTTQNRCRSNGESKISTEC